MKVDIWVNGRLMETGIPRHRAEMMGSYLKGKGWEIRNLTDIGVLAIFDPHFVNSEKSLTLGVLNERIIERVYTDRTRKNLLQRLVGALLMMLRRKKSENEHGKIKMQTLRKTDSPSAA